MCICQFLLLVVDRRLMAARYMLALAEEGDECGHWAKPNVMRMRHSTLKVKFSSETQLAWFPNKIQHILCTRVSVPRNCFYRAFNLRIWGSHSWAYCLGVTWEPQILKSISRYECLCYFTLASSRPYGPLLARSGSHHKINISTCPKAKKKYSDWANSAGSLK